MLCIGLRDNKDLNVATIRERNFKVKLSYKLTEKVFLPEKNRKDFLERLLYGEGALFFISHFLT